MTKTSFLDTAHLIEDVLSAEEAAGPVQGLADLASHRGRRTTIEGSLETLEALVVQLRARWHMLSPLPDEESIRWAQAVRHLPNLAFLELDTDGLSSEADILRVVLLDRDGTALYAHTIKGRRPIPEKITHLTAVRPQDVEHAPSFAEVWPDLAAALQGRYIVSFNLPFDLDKLRENAARFGVEPVTIIGECLMQKAQRYVHQSTYPKLADLCRRIGFPLPEHPVQNAWDRARGQLRLLEAMSQGISLMGEPAKSTVPKDGVDGGDEPPF